MKTSQYEKGMRNGFIQGVSLAMYEAEVVCGMTDLAIAIGIRANIQHTQQLVEASVSREVIDGLKGVLTKLEIASR
jgi:hypothetical protein